MFYLLQIKNGFLSPYVSIDYYKSVLWSHLFINSRIQVFSSLLIFPYSSFNKLSSSIPDVDCIFSVSIFFLSLFFQLHPPMESLSRLVLLFLLKVVQYVDFFRSFEQPDMSLLDIKKTPGS